MKVCFVFFPFAWRKTHSERENPPKTNISGNGEKGERYALPDGDEVGRAGEVHSVNAAPTHYEGAANVAMLFSR